MVSYPSIEKFLNDKNSVITDQENPESHLWCTKDRDLIHDQCYCPAQPYSLLWDKQTRAKGVWDTHLRGATPQCLEILKLTRTQTLSKTDKKNKTHILDLFEYNLFLLKLKTENIVTK